LHCAPGCKHCVACAAVIGAKSLGKYLGGSVLRLTYTHTWLHFGSYVLPTNAVTNSHQSHRPLFPIDHYSVPQSTNYVHLPTFQWSGWLLFARTHTVLVRAVHGVGWIGSTAEPVADSDSQHTNANPRTTNAPHNTTYPPKN